MFKASIEKGVFGILFLIPSPSGRLLTPQLIRELPVVHHRDTGYYVDNMFMKEYASDQSRI